MMALYWFGISEINNCKAGRYYVYISTKVRANGRKEGLQKRATAILSINFISIRVFRRKVVRNIWGNKAMCVYKL